MKAKHYVYTYDTYKQQFTPQQGVRCGPYTFAGLRRALRRLRDMGYGGVKSPCVRVEIDHGILGY